MEKDDLDFRLFGPQEIPEPTAPPKINGYFIDAISETRSTVWAGHLTIEQIISRQQNPQIQGIHFLIEASKPRPEENSHSFDAQNAPLWATHPREVDEWRTRYSRPIPNNITNPELKDFLISVMFPLEETFGDFAFSELAATFQGINKIKGLHLLQVLSKLVRSFLQENLTNAKRYHDYFTSLRAALRENIDQKSAQRVQEMLDYHPVGNFHNDLKVINANSAQSSLNSWRNNGRILFWFLPYLDFKIQKAYAALCHELPQRQSLIFRALRDDHALKLISEIPADIARIVSAIDAPKACENHSYDLSQKLWEIAGHDENCNDIDLSDEGFRVIYRGAETQCFNILTGRATELTRAQLLPWLLENRTFVKTFSEAEDSYELQEQANKLKAFTDFLMQ